MMKAQGFIFPLVLLVLILVSVSSIAIFSEQKIIIDHFQGSSISKTNSQDVQKLEEFSIPDFPQPWSNVVKNTIQLDGLYNLNHLVQTNALNQRIVNEKELKKFGYLLTVCDISPNYAGKILDALTSQSISKFGFTVLDLLAEIGIDRADISNLLGCFRLASPLEKVNLRYANPEHAAALLNMDKETARQVMIKISSNQISNKNELLAFVTSKGTKEGLKSEYRNLTVSPNSLHYATYWTFQGETFAYFEHKFDLELGWLLRSRVIVWLPVLVQ